MRESDIKLKLLLAILIVAGTTVDAYWKECPKTKFMNYTVHIPHEVDCTKFYICDGKAKIEMICPVMNEDGDRLHFNAKLQVCDVPFRAGCVQGSHKLTTQVKSTWTPTTVTSASTKILWSSRQTTSTPRTSIKTTTVKWRPSKHTTLSIDSSFPATTVKHTTMRPANSFKPTTEHEITNTASGWNKTSCSEYDSNTLLPHETNCSLFYICDNGRKVLQKCPKGLHFDKKSQVCKKPKHAGCEEFDITTTPSTLSTRNITEYCSEQNASYDIYVSHECDCRKYYICNNSNLILRECPLNTYFVELLQKCVHGFECNSQSSTKNRLTSLEVTECEDGARWSHEEDCSLYYYCIYGHAMLLKCPLGSYFDEKNQYCDYSENVSCAVPRTMLKLVSSTTQKSLTTVKIPKSCPQSHWESTVHIAHETNCSLFYKCNHGKKVLMECPENLYFNPILQVCDYPWNVDCVTISTKLPTTTQRLTTNWPVTHTTHKVLTKPPGGIMNLCPEDTNVVIRYPHASNCSLFYECEEKKLALKNCEKGFLFNPESLICDYSENVVCESPSAAQTMKYEKVIRKAVLFKGKKKQLSEYMSTSPLPGHTKPKVTTTTDSWENPLTCLGKCPEEDPIDEAVYLPNEDCTKFCECSNGHPYVRPCPIGLHFNKQENVCDFPELADCKTTTKHPSWTSRTTKTVSTPTPIPSKHPVTRLSWLRNALNT